MGDASTPYTVLGLTPGATRQAVDEAYRRLIKLHHPDTGAGDPARAAAINQAYAALRCSAAPGVLVLGMGTARRRGQRRRWWPAVMVGVIVMAAVTLLIARYPTESARQQQVRHRGELGAVPSAQPPVNAGLQVDRRAVSSAVSEAIRLGKGRQWHEASAYRESCAEDLERFPSLPLLDHCVAFDRSIRLLNADQAETRRPFVVSAERLTGNRVMAQARVDGARRAAELMVVQRQADALR